MQGSPVGEGIKLLRRGLWKGLLWKSAGALCQRQRYCARLLPWGYAWLVSPAPCGRSCRIFPSAKEVTDAWHATLAPVSGR